MKIVRNLLLIVAIGIFACSTKTQPTTPQNNELSLSINSNLPTPTEKTQTPEITGEWELVANGLKFPEGPAWDRSNTVYVSAIQARWISRTIDGVTDTFLVAQSSPYTFTETNGILCDEDGSLYVCDQGIGGILHITPDGESTIVTRSFENKRFNNPNDLIFGKNGWLYFTDPGNYSSTNKNGRVFRLNVVTGDVVKLVDNLAFANGIGFSPDGKTGYVCESTLNQIDKFDVDENGDFQNKSLFISLPGGDPDGMNTDVNGNIYVAHHGGGKIYVVSPAGEVVEEIPTPGNKPTNVDFGGPDMKTLFMTEVDNGALYKMQREVAGIKLFSSNKFTTGVLD